MNKKCVIKDITSGKYLQEGTGSGKHYVGWDYGFEFGIEIARQFKSLGYAQTFIRRFNSARQFRIATGSSIPDACLERELVVIAVKVSTDEIGIVKNQNQFKKC